jgi:DNA-directed RNA polymerase alpha subunit
MLKQIKEKEKETNDNLTRLKKTLKEFLDVLNKELDRRARKIEKLERQLRFKDNALDLVGGLDYPWICEVDEHGLFCLRQTQTTNGTEFKRPIEALSAFIRDNVTIENLMLSVRASSCLENMEIKTVKQLLECSYNELLKAKNMGRKSLKELEDILGDLGLALREK